MQTIHVHSRLPAKHGASSSDNVTSDAFSVPAGSLIIALISANGSSSGTTTATVSDTGAGLSWTQLVVANFATTGRRGHASMWYAVTSSDIASMTVTAVMAGSTVGAMRPTVSIMVVRGVDLGNPFVSSAFGNSLSNSVDFSFTKQLAESLLIVCATDWQKRGAASSGTLKVYEGYSQAPGGDGISGLVGYSKLPNTMSETYTYNVNGFGTSACEWNVVRAELRPEPIGISPIVPEVPSGKLTVQVAWTANLSVVDGSTWAWTDITEDVRMAPGISTKLGRGDEASESQPASMTLTLNNPDYRYSLGGLSPNYPNVRRGLPIRVRVNTDATTWKTLFEGLATEYKPVWDDGAKAQSYAVEVQCMGTLHRLEQGVAPLISPLRRGIRTHPNVVQYWPMEEGENAQYFAPDVGSPPLTFSGDVDPAGGTEFVSSAPIVKINDGGYVSGSVDLYDFSNEATTVRWVQTFPDDGFDNDTVLMYIWTQGGLSRWDLVCQATSGALNLFRYNANGTLQGSTGWILFTTNGKTLRLSVEMWQNGSDIQFRMATLEPNASVGVFWADTISSKTLGRVLFLELFPDKNAGGVTFGHLGVYNQIQDIFDLHAEFDGFIGDAAISNPSDTGRLVRIASENEVHITVDDGGNSTTANRLRLGVQPIENLLTIMRECESLEQGQLHDGVHHGLRYVSRLFSETRSADLTIDASLYRLAVPLDPVDNDQRLRNKVTAKASSGSEVVYVDEDGPLGTKRAWVYEDSIEVNTYHDGILHDLAGWLVSKGTIYGYRIPTLTLDLRATPELADAAAALLPGMRVDVTNVDDVLPILGVESLSFLVEGIENDITTFSWIMRLQLSAYEVWNVGTIAAESGDTGEDSLRLTSGFSSLAAGANQGATSISVATAGGPLWTTASDDYPLYLNVGGIRVRATACSGASSPQTFTVDALPTGRTAGQEVDLWQAPGIGY